MLGSLMNEPNTHTVVYIRTLSSPCQIATKIRASCGVLALCNSHHYVYHEPPWQEMAHSQYYWCSIKLKRVFGSAFDCLWTDWQRFASVYCAAPRQSKSNAWRSKSNVSL
eukprot:scaffold14309_cov41-Prasinocladus_malaysianus.AAC.1